MSLPIITACDKQTDSQLSIKVQDFSFLAIVDYLTAQDTDIVK